MIIGLITFVAQKNKLLVDADNNPIGLPTQKFGVKQIGIVIASTALIFFLMNFKTMFNSELDIIGYLIYGAMIAMPLIILTDKSLTKDERDRIMVIFILAFFVIFFWGAFEQAGASLTIFADRQTDRTLFGWEMPASYFQSVNPLAIILLAPLFSSLWLRLGNRGLEPTSPKKMAIGLSLVALGYVVIAFAVYGLGAMDKVSMFWLIGLYVIHTMGELCLSPIGLSMVSKLSPARFSSLLMGTWFLANAAANKFAGTLSALIPGGGEGGEGAATTSFLGFQIANLFDFFLVFIVMCGVAAAVLFVMSRWLEKKMHGVN